MTWIMFKCYPILNTFEAQKTTQDKYAHGELGYVLNDKGEQMLEGTEEWTSDSELESAPSGPNGHAKITPRSELTPRSQANYLKQIHSSRDLVIPSKPL